MVRIRDRIASSHLALLKFEHEEAPQVNLATVDTQLNMHQFNSLFEEDSAVSAAKDSHNSPVQIPSASPNLGSEAPAAWSAVGHAAATGKSGRVIHNLQEEIARLKRDSALWQSRAEEFQRNNEALKSQVENLEEQVRHKEAANEANLRSIERKDRKLEELRADLHNERIKRHDAQIVANETNEAMRVEREKHYREMARLQEEAKYHQNQYEVLSRAVKQEKVARDRRDDKLEVKLRSIFAARDAERECVDRLLVISDQKNREISSLQERQDKMMDLHLKYKEIKDQEFREITDRARTNNIRIDAALKELTETKDKMKWVIQMSEINESKRGNGQPTPEPPASSS